MTFSLETDGRYAAGESIAMQSVDFKQADRTLLLVARQGNAAALEAIKQGIVADAVVGAYLWDHYNGPDDGEPKCALALAPGCNSCRLTMTRSTDFRAT